MKNLIWLAAMVAIIAAVLVSCGDSDEGTSSASAPQIVLEGADIDAVQEIAAGMKVKVNVVVPGGIRAFTIGIESPCLTAEVLGEFGLATEMNLVDPATPAMAATLSGFGFPVGSQVKGQKSLSFDISTLIPLIAQIYDKTSDHNFTLSLTDNASKSVVKTLKFHLAGSSSLAYNNDADLWANTATLTARLADAGVNVAVEYKKSTATTWQQAVVTPNPDGSYKASIAPAWVAVADHVSGVAQYTLNAETGVFAGHTYDIRLINDGSVVVDAVGSFSTAAGQLIPGGSMDNWSKGLGYLGAEANPADYQDYKVFYPNLLSGPAFWSNGNNAFTQTLCVPDTLKNTTPPTYAANLTGGGFSTIFAAGNLYTGVFEMAGIAGYARFGQKYDFTARPSALRVRYKATITKIELLGLKEGVLTTDDTDKARIFVCITDWSDRHSVYSGLGVTVDQINGFDPETDKQTAEGAILAYGSKWIDVSTDGWVELTLPIIYKDKQAKPTAGNYSLVISSAASAYGDYLCGSRSNQLGLDDFEWVY